MNEDFPKLINKLVEGRIETIISSKEHEGLMQDIYQELEVQLSSGIKNLDEKEKYILMEDIKNNIFQQVFNQSELTYRIAFKDAFSLFVDTLLSNK